MMRGLVTFESDIEFARISVSGPATMNLLSSAYASLKGAGASPYIVTTCAKLAQEPPRP